MEDMMPKVEQLRKAYSLLDIQVDGGLTCENVDQASKAGANVIVSGTGIFGHQNPSQAISYMREVVNKYC